jgi:hypothetical protein
MFQMSRAYNSLGGGCNKANKKGERRLNMDKFCYSCGAPLGVPDL